MEKISLSVPTDPVAAWVSEGCLTAQQGEEMAKRRELQQGSKSDRSCAELPITSPRHPRQDHPRTPPQVLLHPECLQRNRL